MTDSGPRRDRDSLAADAIACRQAGRLGEAAVLFARALELDPANTALALLNSETLYRIGRYLSAYDAATGALASNADNADAHFLVGRILTALGRTAEAVDAFAAAIARRADYAAAWRLMAPVLFASGRRGEADAAFQRADALHPESADLYNQIGIELLAQRRGLEAEAAFRRALQHDPRLAAAHQNLGAAMAAQNHLEDAIAAERLAIDLEPGSAAAWNNLSVFENAAGDFAAARRAAERALQVDPRHADALHTLAQIRLEEGDATTAVTLLARVVASHPAHQPAGGGLLLARNYIARESSPADFADARSIAGRLRPDGPGFTFARHDRDPARRLRVGYVSADFRRHSCASFIKPLFSAHDRREIEIVAYSENPVDDDITAELRRCTALWRPVVGLGDAAVAEMIQRDRIDILVDLSGHMAGNRLPVFALKPAPVQVTWLGYPDTTGLAAIDYRITDACADPPDADRFHSERLWRLPVCFIAFEPDGRSPAPVPQTARHGIVFGSFNHLPKVTPAVVAAWSRILAAVPQSRLVMKAKRLGDPVARDRYLRLFADQGIAPDRLEFLGWQDAARDHLSLYDRIDIGLDPFPYNGTATTCEALWMGVPVITLAGARHAGRVGASLLAAAGLGTLVAASEADYVERATALARDDARLQDLKHNLRERMRVSSLCDAPGFARRLEAAFREMWGRWCREGGG